MAIFHQFVPLEYNSALSSNEMAGFEAAWAAIDRAKDGEPVSSELRPLLRQIYSDVLAVPTDLPARKESLARLLDISAVQEKRTRTVGRLICSFACPKAGSETGLNKTYPMTSTTCSR